MKTFWSPDYLLMLSFSLSAFFNSLYILHLFLLFLSYFLTILFFCLLLSFHSHTKTLWTLTQAQLRKLKTFWLYLPPYHAAFQADGWAWARCVVCYLYCVSTWLECVLFEVWDLSFDNSVWHYQIIIQEKKWASKK